MSRVKEKLIKAIIMLPFNQESFEFLKAIVVQNEEEIARLELDIKGHIQQHHHDEERIEEYMDNDREYMERNNIIE